MPDKEAIAALTAKMKGQGIRRLMVLSGDESWTLQQAQHLREQLGGDGLWVGPQPFSDPGCAPGALKTLLGREFQHAFFDARNGFDVAAFAALAGTLKAGSWLVLLTPDFSQWPTMADEDSVRWSDSEQPIPTPNFVHHFCKTLQNDDEAVVWTPHQPLSVPTLPSRPHWQSASGAPLEEQAAILDPLKEMPPGVAVVTAERGRGKSALAGMHLRALKGKAIVTAPAKAATDVLAQFAEDRFHFMAPDVLLASEAQADWLIVDEAAAIPGPLLERLVSRFPRTLLTTTAQGYEGTGRGFLLKFCARFPHLKAFTLNQPIRWAEGCPLERFTAQALMFDDDLPALSGKGESRMQRVEQSAWQTQPALPEAMYKLLSAAHYRTSPLDLRRMMDAPGQHFVSAQRGDELVGALWLVEEGGLSEALSQAVWAGFRRPRGNLVAQSLAAHGGSPQAATLRSRRVSRIAVHPDVQKQGIGQQLIADIVATTQNCDFLSVSFGYTDELWRFWQHCGFRLVRVGTHREASSGCYNAMAVYPLTEAGEILAQHEQLRFERDAVWLNAWRDLTIETSCLPETILTDEDWFELAGFAFAHRPLMAATGSLNRLIAQVDLPLPALCGGLSRVSEAELCQRLAISGRKALLAAQRHEAQSALQALDAPRSEHLASYIKKLN
jgi:Predicted P-loop ATPase fused to an acetyltransferase